VKRISISREQKQADSFLVTVRLAPNLRRWDNQLRWGKSSQQVRAWEERCCRRNMVEDRELAQHCYPTRVYMVVGHMVVAHMIVEGKVVVERLALTADTLHCVASLLDGSDAA